MLSDFSEIDQIFFVDGHNIAKKYLSDITSESVSKVSTAMYQAIEQLLEAFEERLTKENQSPACKKGCHYCCMQAVFISPREAFYLADYLKNKFDKEILDNIKSKCAEKVRLTSEMNLEQVIKLKHDCPLLKDKACLAYEARPMACRIYLSMDLPSCIDFYNYPEKEGVFAKLFEFPLHAGRSMNEGVAAFLNEKKIEVQALSLESGLHYALNDSESINKWINSEKSFTFPQWSDSDMELLQKKGSVKS